VNIIFIIIGIIIFGLIAILVVSTIKGNKLLSRMKYEMPDGYILFRKYTTGILFTKKEPYDTGLHVHVAASNGREIDSYLKSYLRGINVDFDKIEPLASDIQGWTVCEDSGISYGKEIYIRIHYAIMPGKLVIVILKTDVNNPEDGIEEAGQLINSIRFENE